MGIRKKCLIITLLCFSSLMHASEFMFKHLEVKDGLSNNQVLDIFKDSEGFMWFATASGLNRYDGCQMTLFRSYNADPASLPDNYIKSIQEDYKGNLWILTGVGYVIYNSESETFDRDITRLAVRPLLLDWFKGANSRDVQQEGYIPFREFGDKGLHLNLMFDFRQ